MPQRHAVHIGAGDAVAIVAHRDLTEAAGMQLYDDLVGAGIERVVDQLAHDRERPLDHFAGPRSDPPPARRAP